MCKTFVSVHIVIVKTSTPSVIPEPFPCISILHRCMNKIFRKPQPSAGLGSLVAGAFPAFQCCMLNNIFLGFSLKHVGVVLHHIGVSIFPLMWLFLIYKTTISL